MFEKFIIKMILSFFLKDIGYIIFFLRELLLWGYLGVKLNYFEVRISLLLF